MKMNRTEYLLSKGYNPDDKSEKVLEAIKEYEKAYQQEYRKSRNKRSKRFELWFDLRLVRNLTELAKKLGISVTGTIKKIVRAYFEEIFVLPDENMLRALRLEIKRIGNLVNQIAVKINASNTVFHSDIKKIQNWIAEMEERIADIFRKPVNLLDLIWQVLEKNPGFLVKLKELIAKFENR